MLRKSFFYNALIAIVTLVLVVGGFTSFQRKRSSFERLDFRWTWDRGVICPRGDPGEWGGRAGLKPGAGSDGRREAASEVAGLRKTREGGQMPCSSPWRPHRNGIPAPPLRSTTDTCAYVHRLCYGHRDRQLVRGRKSESSSFTFSVSRVVCMCKPRPGRETG